MTRQSNIDTTRQEFLKESYKKESLLRNKWFKDYFGSNQLPKGVGDQDTTTSPIPSNRVPKATLIKIKPAPPTPPKRASPTFVLPEPLNQPGPQVPEMRMPTPETKGMIYSGLSAEGDGRKAYLVKRKLKGPEEKFEYPLTSSLEVGWNIREVSKKCETKQGHFGKSRIIRDTFFAENGVM